jgi:Membrane-associating domain
VAGITGAYLNSVSYVSNSDATKARFIYTEVVAALSILLALLWLLPFSGTFIHWPIDFLLFVCWIVAFGLLVNVSCDIFAVVYIRMLKHRWQFIGPLDCGNLFYWGDITQQGVCQRWKADVAFAFLSAIFWLASTLLVSHSGYIIISKML